EGDADCIYLSIDTYVLPGVRRAVIRECARRRRGDTCSRRAWYATVVGQCAFAERQGHVVPEVPIVERIAGHQAAGASVRPAVLLEAPDVVVDVEGVMCQPGFGLSVRVVHAAKNVGSQRTRQKWVDPAGLVALHGGERQVRPSEGEGAGERERKDKPLHRLPPISLPESA